MSYVYIIQAGSGPYKIGVAKNLERRIEQMQVGNHEELRLVAAIDFETEQRAIAVEKQLHKMYLRARIRGEWFDNSIQLKRADEFFNTHFRDDKTFEQQEAEVIEFEIIAEARKRI